jgi:glucosamine--fructose-6-phosphate aminotransferase (isomerizing)
MPNETYATYGEIKGQTEAWKQALESIRISRLPTADEFEQTIFIGCGSTYYLALAAAALYQQLTGRSATAIPSGELLLNPEACLTDQKTLLVAISRSGTTSETILAVDHIKSSGKGKIVTISCYNQELSRLGDTNIVIPKGQERSVAQTRSFASMYLTAVGFAARMAGREDLLENMKPLPEMGLKLIQKYESLSRTLGRDLTNDRFYFLGSGILYGLACEANLKMKEMTLTHSEPFHFLEFRHGPMSMVNEGSVVIGLVSEKNHIQEMAVLSEMEALGGKVVSIGESGREISFDSGLPEPIRAILYLPVLQLMAYYRSLAKNLNPDRPRNLQAVVKLDLKRR